MTSLSRIDPRPARAVRDPARVTSLAARALDMLATSRRRDRPAPVESWVRALAEAAIDPDPAARRDVARRMRAAGVTGEDIGDVYIPAAARRLGEAWSEDRLSFAAVSIGSARLQALLRDAQIAAAQDPVDGAGELRVMVLADAHHTLGAMVLTNQLRRTGTSVRLGFLQQTDEVDRIVSECGFDAILVSVARADDFTPTADAVARLRRLTGGRVPLIAGGSIMDLGADSARCMTGADHATGDPRRALELIGEWAAR